MFRTLRLTTYLLLLASALAMQACSLSPSATQSASSTSTAPTGATPAGTPPAWSFKLLTITPSANQLVLTWQTINGPTSYTVKYGTVSGSYPYTVANNATSPQSISYLKPGVVYYFMVTAKGGGYSVNAQNEMSGSVSQAFTTTYSFNASGIYTSSNPSTLDLNNGTVAKLSQITPTTPNASTVDASFTTPSLSDVSAQLPGTMNVSYSSGNKITLNATNNQWALDPSWTPEYSNLIAYWQFDGDMKDKISGLTLVPTGTSAVTTTTPKIGSGALSSPGTDNVGVTLPAAVGGGEPYSVSGWVKADPTFDTNSFSRVFSLTCDNSNYLMDVWLPGASTGNPLMLIWYRYTGSAQPAANSAFDAMSNNNYHFLTFVYIGTGGGDMNVYVDGIQSIYSGYTTQQISGSCKNFYVGQSFKGQYDDVALWNVALNQTEITTIYQKQASRYSGQYLSRIMDTNVQKPAWYDFRWNTNLPYGKELTSATESSSQYSAMTANFANGLIGLWHLDETSESSTIATALDSSGHGAHGTASSSFPANIPGVIGNAALLSPSWIYGDGGITVPSAQLTGVDTTFTTCFWMQSTDPLAHDSAYSTAISKITGGTATTSHGFSIGRNGASQNLQVRVDSSAVNNQIATSTATPYDGHMHHVCVAFGTAGTGGGTVGADIYVDGNFDKKMSYLPGTGLNDGSPFTMGKNAGTLNTTGYIILDEVGLWSRDLSAAEILELFHRTANSDKFQIRTCAMSNCSDYTASSSGWIGPDGTNGTFFSEANNTTNYLDISTWFTTPTIVTTAPDYLFSLAGTTFPNFLAWYGTSNKRYFQYRVQLDSWDQNATPSSPEIDSVGANLFTFDTTAPSVTSTALVNAGFTTLSGFSEIMGPNLCPGGVKYQLSTDGSTWYYWGGTGWVHATSGNTTANTAIIVNSFIASFPAVVAAPITSNTSLYVRAFLSSNGVQPCELASVTVTGSGF